ncbi:MAG: AAA family ATPase [Planctomycetes bacterium]|nr:AAA family ATPase [Planctomycetota bacterium]
MSEIEPLTVVQAAAVEGSSELEWLVEGLWVAEGVGIVGGNPKAGKTWLALDLALSVASGTPALGVYAIPRAGPVLLFAAEDPPATVRARLEGIAVSRGLTLKSLPLHVILASSLRLDQLRDQARLAEAVERFRPRLLVLDPFVRLHRINENSAQEVSGVLAYLRDLQRRCHVAVLVVHHARKAGAGTAQAGLSLRGSGDFYAWGDELLHMRRRKTALELVVEHRSAASPEPVPLELLAGEGEPVRLAVVSAADSTEPGAALAESVVEVLKGADGPLTQEALRVQLRVRWTRLAEPLRALEREGRVEKTAGGYALRVAEGQEEIAWRNGVELC